jgi:nicotinate phosphoribosyltransferase
MRYLVCKRRHSRFSVRTLIIVKGPAIQAQLIETMVLLTINFQSLIATKSARMNYAAVGKAIMNSAPDGRKVRRGDAGGKGRLFRGMQLDRLRDRRPVFWHSRGGNDGAQRLCSLFENEYEAFCAYAQINRTTARCYRHLRRDSLGNPHAIRVLTK